MDLYRYLRQYVVLFPLTLLGILFSYLPAVLVLLPNADYPVTLVLISVTALSAYVATERVSIYRKETTQAIKRLADGPTSASYVVISMLLLVYYLVTISIAVIGGAYLLKRTGLAAPAMLFAGFSPVVEAKLAKFLGWCFAPSSLISGILIHITMGEPPDMDVFYEYTPPEYLFVTPIEAEIGGFAFLVVLELAAASIVQFTVISLRGFNVINPQIFRVMVVLAGGVLVVVYYVQSTKEPPVTVPKAVSMTFLVLLNSYLLLLGLLKVSPVDYSTGLIATVNQMGITALTIVAAILGGLLFAGE